jgi:hypothetical protein
LSARPANRIDSKAGGCRISTTTIVPAARHARQMPVARSNGAVTPRGHDRYQGGPISKFEAVLDVVKYGEPRPC